MPHQRVDLREVRRDEADRALEEVRSGDVGQEVGEVLHPRAELPCEIAAFVEGVHLMDPDAAVTVGSRGDVIGDRVLDHIHHRRGFTVGQRYDELGFRVEMIEDARRRRRPFVPV